jgi:large subunit ribosomal protein L29
MKARLYREMSTDELEDKMQELQRHVFDLRSQAATEKLQDCRLAINTRREIARIKTVLHQRQIETSRQQPAVRK